MAPVALRIRCLQKSIEIVDVCKTNGNQRFCMPSAWILCPIVFAFSYLGLVLSLRDVESRRRSWCPEVASDYFALTFSVSRGPFRIFGLMRPAAGLNFWVLRCPAAVWPSNVVDEHLGGAPP